MRLIIVEKFALKDGSTVFAVMPDNRHKEISEGKFNLVINGKKVAEIWIDGENLPENQGRSLYKSVSTQDSVKFKDISFQSEKWELIKDLNSESTDRV